MSGQHKRLILLLLAFTSMIKAQVESWTLLAPTGTLPGPRDSVNAVYSSASNRLIAFGGYPHFTTETNDLWILQNANGLGTPAWTLAIPAGAPGSPQPRLGAAMVYDSQNNRAMLFGGEASSGSLLDDVWVLMNADGTSGTPSWVQLNPTGSLPGMVNHLLGYDPNSNRLILIMGERAGMGTDPVEVWILTNANGLGGTPTWTQLATIGSPPGRLMVQMDQSMYDPAANRFIVFGGWRQTQLQILNDVWVLSNANGFGGASAWTQISPSGALPPPRYGASGFYDAVTNRLGIFGGQNELTGVDYNDYWLLNNANGVGGAPVWNQVSPGGNLPWPRFGSSGVYDSIHNRMIVFAGSVQGLVANETWVLSNANGIVGSNLAIQYVSPSQGGNAGSVTMQIVGSGFQSGAAVTLTGSGAAIVGANTGVANASALTTTFNLTATPPGARNVVVTNPDTTSITLPSAFTVQQGGAPQLWAQMVGNTRIRIGVVQTFYISYGNLGTTDALGTRLIAYVPSSLAPNLTLGNSNGVATTTTQGPTTLIMINLGRVPAGSTSTIPVTLTAGVSQAPFQMQVSISGH